MLNTNDATRAAITGMWLRCLSSTKPNSPTNNVAANGSAGMSTINVSALNMAAVNHLLDGQFRLDARLRQHGPMLDGGRLFGQLLIDELRLVRLADRLPDGDVELAAAMEQHQHQRQCDRGLARGHRQNENHQNLSAPVVVKAAPADQ